jgi:hypothetical protein
MLFVIVLLWVVREKNCSNVFLQAWNNDNEQHNYLSSFSYGYAKTK